MPLLRRGFLLGGAQSSDDDSDEPSPDTSPPSAAASARAAPLLSSAGDYGDESLALLSKADHAAALIIKYAPARPVDKGPKNPAFAAEAGGPDMPDMRIANRTRIPAEASQMNVRRVCDMEERAHCAHKGGGAMSAEGQLVAEMSKYAQNSGTNGKKALTNA